MKHINLYFIFLLLVSFPVLLMGRDHQGTMNYTVSMDQPWTHYYHVELDCDGIKAQTMDFKMPAWTPGYYMILDLAKYVINFKASDGNGNEFTSGKTDKNTWRIETNDSPVVIISYDVFAFIQTVGHPFLDDGRAFISPTGVFMYPDGHLDHPVTVSVKPYDKWNNISTGLDLVNDQSNTFSATDFDMLYDCPILAGNHEVLTFEVRGIPHSVVMEDPLTIDPVKYTADLKKMVEAAVDIIGEIPYKHYAFLIMGEGMGGLEHRNSMAVFSSGRWYSLENQDSYHHWMEFLAHEYFHLYNVKTIRPIALGPFDYDRENYTDMLWFSEGVTSYYEYIILNRSGLVDRDESLQQLQSAIVNYENIPGHLFQPVSMASFDTWILFFNRSENASNTTISYYDKGCALGMLLDLKIRYETQSKKSLDDVMRTLYYRFHKEKGRGFTDREFRDVCEEIAGCSLSGFFEYTTTTQTIDYQEYLGYAGLAIDTTAHILPGIDPGFDINKRDAHMVISNVEWNSPAWFGGLSPRDTILYLNDQQATSSLLDDILSSGNPGDKLEIVVGRRSGRVSLEIIPKARQERTFSITMMSQPTPFQAELLRSWLKD